LQNLAGIAKQTIQYIVENNTKVRIDNDGYLLSVWNNPLNGNGDYLSRYEKSSHVDELNEDNRLYGYDGPFYPDAVTNSEMQKAINSLTTYASSNNSWYRGLNLSDKERESIRIKLAKFKGLILDFAADDQVDIIRYGLDVYGNSYTLMKSKHTAGNPILWFKAKNHPYSFPAIVYD